jgi:hypothetical protein
MRVIQLKDNGFKPLVHDLIKTMSTLVIIEALLYMFNSDPLLDKIFVRMMVYNIIGLFFFYFIVDKLIGMGDSCCHLFSKPEDEKKRDNA